MISLEVIRVQDKITWISSKQEAKYWWDELENFQLECWEVIKKECSLKDLREFLKQVDELTKDYDLSYVLQALVGATMIKRFLWSVYNELDLGRVDRKVVE